MKREEAIAILDGFKHNPLFNEQHFEALDMAISALSAPSANVISIDQANAMIKSYVSHYEENTGEWIPVSERLPEEEQEVLCQLSDGSCAVLYVQDNWGQMDWVDGQMGTGAYDVIAWQPLPELYQKGGE